jgi:redox-sensitive bicupin YhaK (pirin superfamily)
VRLPTIDVRPASQRFSTSGEGLESRHSFSFGQHYAPDNVGHGRLMVNNDELVSTGAGFGDHPHRDAEIITWVLSGSLVHEDSFGNRGEVYPGLAQRMSAGRGIVHSERNDAFRLDPTRAVQPVHFVQMWVRPDEAGGEPSYLQQELSLADLATGWLPVASGQERDAVVTLGARESTLWVTVLAPGVTRQLPSAPFVHVYVARGDVELESAGLLMTGDSVRITGDAALKVRGRSEAELLVWAMAA